MKAINPSFLLIMIGIFMNSFCSFAQEQKLHESEPEYVSINQGKIAYHVIGEGKPIILCMGYASNMDLWSTDLLLALEKEYKVIIYDYRGMGLSNNQASSFTIESLANDMNQLLTHLEIEKTHVLGWSMGGFVAQMFAVNFSDKVDKLILYATNCGDTITVYPDQKIIDILASPKSTPMELLGTLFPDQWMKAHAQPWKFLPQEKEPMNGQTISLEYEAVSKWLSPGGGSAYRLSKLKMPTLVICGEDDKVVPAINSHILSDSIPNAVLIKADEVGHGFMYQRPSSFSKFVLGFLNIE